jgi:hypothetical protein
MLQRMRRFLRLAVGERLISVEHETPTRLELRYGGLRTVFDRTEDKVTQNGRLVAILQLVESIELHKPTSQEGAQNWIITVHVRGQRQVEVGQVTDGTDASIVGASIATVAGRQVKVSS